jgi:hypothetical protein
MIVINLFPTERSQEWAVEAHRWVSVEEALIPGKYDKYVRLNVEEAVEKGFLRKIKEPQPVRP